MRHTSRSKAVGATSIALSISSVDTIDFMRAEKRDEAAARRFFTKAIGLHGLPEKVVFNKSGSNAAALETLNWQIWLSGIIGRFIEVL